MRFLVAVVICSGLLVPVGAATSHDSGALLLTAARLSGLPVRRAVPTAIVRPHRYDALIRRAYEREYPRSLQRVDARLYELLGLMTQRPTRTPPVSRFAWYDATASRLLLRLPLPARTARRHILHELTRALIDQSFDLRRLTGLRARDRDRSLAANGIVEGTAALASKLGAATVRGSPLERFSRLEHDAGLGPGRALAGALRYLGGRKALATALRTFPQTTEQLLHVDKFLERERALPTRLATQVGDWSLSRAETFGELDVRSLLRAYAMPDAAATAAGWGGGRIGLYVTPRGEAVAALVLRWDTVEEAGEWRAALTNYAKAAFPDARPLNCPPLDRCWSSPTAQLAAGQLGDVAVFASGSGAAQVAAELLRGKN